VGLGDAAADGQPEPHPADAHVRSAVKFLEDPLERLSGQPGPPVGHLDLDAPGQGARRDLDRGIRGGIFGRILQQVHEDLLDQDRVDRQERQVRRQRDVDRPRAEARLEPAQGRADHLLERHPLALDLQRARLQPGHVEQVPDQALQALGLLADGLEQIGPLDRRQRRAVVAQRRGRAGDGGQRRAQIVGDGAEERAAHLLGAGPQHGGAGVLGEAGAPEGQAPLLGEGAEEIAILAARAALAGRGEGQHADG
jgi:hypothetical protein